MRVLGPAMLPLLGHWSGVDLERSFTKALPDFRPSGRPSPFKTGGVYWVRFSFMPRRSNTFRCKGMGRVI